MKELIKITEQNGTKAVSARELYEFLGFDKSNWAKWYRKNIENNEFAFENVDYQTFVLSTNGNETKDFALSIEFAKKISMMARTEKGEEARRYFIECEKQLKTALPQTYKEALLELIKKEEEKEALLLENQAQQKQLEAQAPKVLFTEAVMGSQSSCLVGELAKIITQNGYEIGEKRLFKWLRENNYLGQKGERYNIPNQQYIEQGLFELKKGTRSGNNGVMHTTITTKITGKGQVYFVNKFLKYLPQTA